MLPSREAGRTGVSVSTARLHCGDRVVWWTVRKERAEGFEVYQSGLGRSVGSNVPKNLRYHLQECRHGLVFTSISALTSVTVSRGDCHLVSLVHVKS